MYHISSKPHPLHRITHQTHPRPRQLFRNTDITVHIHERDGQQRPILFQSSDQTFLTLRHEKEPLRADRGDCSHSTFDFFFGDELECVSRFGMVGFGDDVDDGEDVDVAAGGEVFASEEGCAYYDEVLALVGDF